MLYLHLGKERATGVSDLFRARRDEKNVVCLIVLTRMWRLRGQRKFIVDARVLSENDTKLRWYVLFFVYADVAELVDALASGASVRKYVEVQVLFAAPRLCTVTLE